MSVSKLVNTASWYFNHDLTADTSVRLARDEEADEERTATFSDAVTIKSEIKAKRVVRARRCMSRT